MLSAVVTLAGLALALTAVLLAAAKRWPDHTNRLVGDVEQLLPRIHCAQCGYPGCKPYAAAIVDGSADINLCPPGGEDTIRRLATLLGRDALPLGRAGTANMLHIARIDERECIGCNLCARACPVDAIVGIPQTMHTVLSDHCTGCELCIPPCPVDCIAMVMRNG